jgi:hypothetical protein
VAPDHVLHDVSGEREAGQCRIGGTRPREQAWPDDMDAREGSERADLVD